MLRCINIVNAKNNVVKIIQEENDHMRNKTTISLCSTIASILFAAFIQLTVSAAPICPMPQDFTQPDGSVISLTTYGDEFFSWKEDKNGNIIAYDEKTGSYKYAEIKGEQIVPGPQTVGASSLLSIFSHKIKREDIMPLWENAERIDYSKSAGNDNIQLMGADEEQQKSLTHQKLLTILIEFNDVGIKHGAKFWSRQMFSTEQNALSVVNYWKENSNGLTVFESAAISGASKGRTGKVSYGDYTDIDYKITECEEGVITVSLDIPHPIKKDSKTDGSEESKVCQLVTKAIENDVDFKKEKPWLVTIFAGYESPYGYESQQVQPRTLLGTVTLSDGSNVGGWVVQGENIYNDVPAGIGTTCHELGHLVFDLPDLYYSIYPAGTNDGLLYYSLMSIGCWGQRYSDKASDYDDPYANYIGHVPAHLDAWCKKQLGYVTTMIVNDEWEGYINSISDSGDNLNYNVLEIRSKADPKQYFLVENRQLIGFDKGLEYLNHNYHYDSGDPPFDGGIIIYHIDENVFENNNNNRHHHRFISIESSVNTPYTDNSAYAWAYQNIEGRNLFDSETVPNSNFHETDILKDCTTTEICHPEVIPSGISVEVLGENSSSVRVKANVEAEYVIGQENKRFSELFPDENFCKAVLEILEQEDGIKRTVDSVLSISDFVKLSSIDCLMIENRNIKNLQGLEYFPKLTDLCCENNELTELKITDNPELMLLSCNNNKLTELDISSCKNLGWLYCENNLLTELNLENNNELAWLYCYNNKLTKLNIKNCPDIYRLHCYDNYMDENPYNAIDGLINNIEKLGNPASIENPSVFTYYPQKVVAPTAEPTITPTVEPTATATPTPIPTVEPTEQPTTAPTVMPTVTPTAVPTTEPTETPKPDNYPYKIASTDMSGGTVTLRIEKSYNAPAARIIFAEYDGGTLKRVQVESTSSDEKGSFTRTFEYSGEDYKAFIWDALGTMTPLAESAEYKK